MDSGTENSGQFHRVQVIEVHLHALEDRKRRLILIEQRKMNGGEAKTRGVSSSFYMSRFFSAGFMLGWVLRGEL
jgi:hypothetical protein